MKENDVISIVTTVGEFVGKYVSVEPVAVTRDGVSTMHPPIAVTVKDPRMVMHNKEGMGFNPGISMTGKSEPDQVEFYITNVVFFGETSEPVKNAYLQFTSGIVLP